MSALSRRVTKLEDQLGLGNAGHRIVIYSNASKEENAAELRRNGIDPDDPSNFVVAIVLSIINPDGTSTPANPVPKIHSIQDMSKWPRR